MKLGNRKFVCEQPRTETLITNYTRRNSDWSTFGQGFDSERVALGSDF